MMPDTGRMKVASRSHPIRALRACGRAAVLAAASGVIAAVYAAAGAAAERPGLFPELLDYERDCKRIAAAGPAAGARGMLDDERELLATCERRYGRRSSEAAEASFPLAECLYNAGAVAEGLDLMRHAIGIRAEAHGEDAVELTCDLFLLSEFLERENHVEEAIALAERALDIHERASGLDHPDTVLALERLAELHAGLGDERAAETFRQRARRSRSSAAPETNPDALDWPQLFRPHEHCGARRFAAGDVSAATFHFERAVALRPELGENHNNMGTVLSTMAQEATQRGAEDEAAARMADAVRSFAKACRLEPHVPAMRVNYANALAAAGRFQEAADAYEDLLEKQHDNAALINNLGVALFKSGRREEAIEQFRRALAIDPDLQDARDSLEFALDAEE